MESTTKAEWRDWHLPWSPKAEWRDWHLPVAPSGVAPVEVGIYDTPGDAYGVGVAGSYAYVADWSADLEVFTSCDGLVFQDDFERGDPSAWSLAVP